MYILIPVFVCISLNEMASGPNLISFLLFFQFNETLHTYTKMKKTQKSFYWRELKKLNFPRLLTIERVYNHFYSPKFNYNFYFMEFLFLCFFQWLFNSLIDSFHFRMFVFFFFLISTSFVRLLFFFWIFLLLNAAFFFN